jgi:hypothetical protein
MNDRDKELLATDQVPGQQTSQGSFEERSEESDSASGAKGTKSG